MAKKYEKTTPRIVVKFINNDNDELLFEINDRNWLNVGEIFPSSTMTGIVTNGLKNRKLPNSILVIAVAEYKLSDDE